MNTFLAVSAILMAVLPFGFAQFNNRNINFQAFNNTLTIITIEDTLKSEWEEFKLTHNKRYRNLEEELLRREIYLTNRGKIAKYNQASARGQMSFTSKLNSFGDMLQNEFTSLLNGFNRTVKGAEGRDFPEEKSTTFIPRANVAFPQHVDWRIVGAVSPVRNQGACAGCWAVSAAGALEGQTFRKIGRLNVLSPQNLIDCNKPRNNGCKGGTLAPAYQYVRDNGGLDREDAYAYEARDANCRFKTNAIGAEDTGYVEIPRGDELALEDAVATIGPISAAIDANRESFQFYSKGVYFDPECKNEFENLNHAILIVGYGVEPNGEKYWLVKNSYGDTWGDDGYIKIAKNANNQCGIASWASYPLV